MIFDFFFKKKMAVKNESRNFPTRLLNNLLLRYSNKDFISEGYKKNSAVYRAIQEIVGGAQNTVFVMRDTSTMKKVTDHVILQLLQKPNIGQSGKEFLETILSYYLLTGNVFILITKEPHELYLLPPDNVTVIPGKYNLPAGYECFFQEKRVTIPVDQITGKCDIIHWKKFNPSNPLIGLSPLESVVTSIEINNKGKLWNAALIGNACRPSGALTVDGDLTEEQYDRLKAQMSIDYSGQDNVGKTFVFEKGTKWSDMSISPRDMDFIDSQNNSEREIGAALGIPHVLFTPEHATYNNLREGKCLLWDNTILPLLDRLCDQLNQFLLPHFCNTDNLSLDIDFDKIPALVDKRNQYWDTMVKGVESGIITIDEARHALGYSPRKVDKTC